MQLSPQAFPPPNHPPEESSAAPQDLPGPGPLFPPHIRLDTPSTFHCVPYKAPVHSGSLFGCVHQSINKCLQSLSRSSPMRDTETYHFSCPTDQPGLEIILFTLWWETSVIDTWANYLTVTAQQGTDLVSSLIECQVPNPHLHKNKHLMSLGERLFSLLHTRKLR